MDILLPLWMFLPLSDYVMKWHHFFFLYLSYMKNMKLFGGCIMIFFNLLKDGTT